MYANVMHLEFFMVQYFFLEKSTEKPDGQEEKKEERRVKENLSFKSYGLLYLQFLIRV